MKSNYFKITDPELMEKIRTVFGEKVGTYKLHWIVNNEPRKINRLNGHDSDGVLYIGMTEGALYNRVTSLATAIEANSDHSQPEPEESGHKTLAKKFFRIRKLVKIEDLYVEVFRCDKKPKEDESLHIENYIAEFGELPPLNGNYGSHAHWELF
jgi:hypothetical protein